MKRLVDCIVGLRQSGGTSGVGLFNDILASRLGVPYVLLKEYGGGGLPMLSLKFEELTAAEEVHLARILDGGVRGVRDFALFLHTLAGSDAERLAIARARVIFCGNDFILGRLAADPGQGTSLVRAFAPSLIPDSYRAFCGPGGMEFFYFGMAGKIDRERFLKLRSMLDALGTEYKLLCSLAIHQTSDGSCLPAALDFFSSTFPETFIFLGNLTQMGVSYFLNSPNVFLGFYREGLRSNNTTFNTALRFGKKIITNLDAFSPEEARASPDVLDIDSASRDQLAAFLAMAGPRSGKETFTWEGLLELVQATLAEADEEGPAVLKARTQAP